MVGDAQELAALALRQVAGEQRLGGSVDGADRGTQLV